MGMVKEIDFTTAPRRCTELDVRAGARNLLVNGCEVGKGTELVILNERGLVDPAVADIIEEEAHKLGAAVYVMWADASTGPNNLPAPVMAAIADCDVALLNHLIAAILRLVPFEGTGLKMMNPLTTWDLLGSAYARVPYRVGLDILQTLGKQVAGASEWHMTCPLGTDLCAPIPQQEQLKNAGNGTGDSFTLRSFPLSVSSVFSSMQASGTLALQWITPSTTRALNSRGTILPSPVIATLEQGSMVDFSGDPVSIKQLKAYLDQVGAEVGKDGYIVNSWHAGTQPGCFSDVSPRDDFFAWILMAHGNPRLAHFHLIGAPVPGEGSAPVLDPTIRFDGRPVWEKGRLNLLNDELFRAQVSSYCDAEEALRRVDVIGV